MIPARPSASPEPTVTTTAPEAAPDLGQVLHDLMNHLSPVANAAALLRLLVPGPDPRVAAALDIIDRQVHAMRARVAELRGGR